MQFKVIDFLKIVMIRDWLVYLCAQKDIDVRHVEARQKSTSGSGGGGGTGRDHVYGYGKKDKAEVLQENIFLLASSVFSCSTL